MILMAEKRDLITEAIRRDHRGIRSSGETRRVEVDAADFHADFAAIECPRSKPDLPPVHVCLIRQDWGEFSVWIGPCSHCSTIYYAIVEREPCPTNP